MRVETGKISDVSNLQKRFDEIAAIEDLEANGIHAHSLLKTNSKMPDAPLLETIDKAIHMVEAEHPSELTFAKRNRIITRRQSKRTISTLMSRRHIKRFR